MEENQTKDQQSSDLKEKYEFYTGKSEDVQENKDLAPWKIIVADDVDVVHSLTTSILKYFSFEGAPVSIIDAYSGSETRKLLEENPDTAVIFLDVVMETDEEGLEVVKYIRDELKNSSVQIILRTGQAGRFPESVTVANNEINIFQSKSDLKADKLISLLTSSLRSYKHSSSLQNLNQNLEKEVTKHLITEDKLRKSEQKYLDINTQLKESHQKLQLKHKEFKESQSQLIHTEKMALLGQLIAGIAHEINTPMGAIKSSSESIYAQLGKVFDLLPDLLKILTSEEQKTFFTMIRNSIQNSSHLSMKEKRKKKKELSKSLEKNGINNAAGKAEILVSLGIMKDFEIYSDLLNHPEADQILQLVSYIGDISKNNKNVRQASERANKIIRSLKSFSRQDHSDELIVTDLQDNLEVVLEIFNHQLKLGFEVERVYSSPVSIACNPDALIQVWTNLVHNAIQAMDKSGKLTITIDQNDQEAIVTISDTGKGIPEEILEKIFQPFFSTKPPGEGTGLGLDIAKKIIEHHKGTISVESKIDKGSKFRVTIPK